MSQFCHSSLHRQPRTKKRLCDEHEAMVTWCTEPRFGDIPAFNVCTSGCFKVKVKFRQATLDSDFTVDLLLYFCGLKGILRSRWLHHKPAKAELLYVCSCRVATGVYLHVPAMKRIYARLGMFSCVYWSVWAAACAAGQKLINAGCKSSGTVATHKHLLAIISIAFRQ